MSVVHEQALIEASAADVWQLVGDPRRYPEWWPRVVEVEGNRFEEGSDYVQVTRGPNGDTRSTFAIDQLDDMREIRMHCQLTGTFAHWRLTDAQGGTFVDLELGMEPIGVPRRVWDTTMGKRFFRGWIADSLAGLRKATGP